MIRLLHRRRCLGTIATHLINDLQKAQSQVSHDKAIVSHVIHITEVYLKSRVCSISTVFALVKYLIENHTW